MERRKFLAVVMAVLMALTMLPSMVFAAESPSGELGGKLKIKGLATVGTVLSADYSKVTPEGVTDADVTFSWSRQTEEKELTQVGTDKNYTVTQDDLGYKLVLDIVAPEGSTLTGKLTAKTAEVAATEEEAKAAQQDAQESEDAGTDTQDTASATLDNTADNTADDAENVEQEDGSQNAETVENDQTEEDQNTYGQLEENQNPYEEMNQNEEAAQEVPVQENQQSDEENPDAAQTEETEEGTSTDDSQLHIYTESELQADGTEKTENGYSQE